MKKLITLALVVLVLGFVTASPQIAFGQEPVYQFDTKVKPAKPYKIAVVVKNFTNPFWLTHQKAAEQAGKDFGLEITVLAPTKPDNVEEQIRILEDLVSKKVDAVVLAPANTQAIAAGVRKLNAAKIPVVYDNTRGSGGEFVAYIGADNILVGRTMAEEMVKRMGGKGKLLVLEGFPGQQTADDRLKGVKEVLAKNPGIQVISRTGKWTLDEGRNVTENTLQRWPDLNAIVGIGGEMSLGAVEAVSCISFFVGTVALLLAALLVGQGALTGASRATWWELTGGFLGAFFVTCTIIVVPRVGTLAAMTAVIAAQLMTGIVLDHFGLFRLQQIPFDAWRASGVALLAAGAAIVLWR